jgi:Fe2+ transport system protein FeoA
VQPERDKVLSLGELRPGQAGRIAAVVAQNGVLRRLLELGLTEGTVVAVVREAPLGDPIEVWVRDYRLSLRRSEARCIQVGDVRRIGGGWRHRRRHGWGRGG